MVCCLQSGLRELSSEFIAVKKVDSDGKTIIQTPTPRVPMPYIYLVSWFVLHCPPIMTTPESSGTSTPLIQQLETSEWAGWYQIKFREILRRDYNYEIACKFPAFEGGAYGELHQDTPGPNSFTMLSRGAFWWLINIRLGYLIFRQGRKCFIEPYQPYRFSRKFGYDQLYVGNPKPTLAYTGNVYEGARACLQHEYLLLESHPQMVRLKKSAKRFRARGASEYLSYEKSIPEDERQQSPEPIQEEVRMPDTREVEPSGVQTRSKSATGKRALGPVEEAKYDKIARRKLTLEPPASKLMSDAQKAWRSEEEEQESTALELSPRPSLPTVGPALGVPDSPAHSLYEEERGDESFAGDKKLSPQEMNYKILRSLSPVWEPKATVIEEAHDLTTLPLDGLIGKLKVHKKKIKEKEKEEERPRVIEEPSQKKTIALK
ncbi:uncharacterized protein A4U43_C10F10970 [Asparagus officinalis]|uniref:Uncharacterized protein n=1 Tax=Asparagus officinalis TaxID=4686 RepID=A0A5P1E3S8_ASPOF|nr:uncharacterized protein A4U43_C10F10970 [Asparagus officinalis]